MARAATNFEDEISARHQEMIEDLESISVDNLKSNGVQLSFGGKTFKFNDLEIVEDDSLEKRLRKEYKEKLNDQQTIIREKINAKINQLLLMHQQKQQELDRKEKNIKRKYADMAMMPEISEKHMLKGLSVVKGSANDELVWIYRAVYNPRFILIADGSFHSKKDRKPIPSRLVNRLKKDILIVVKTKKERITSLVTKKTKKDNESDFELPSFQHYHQTNSGNDCWGTWTWETKWNSPDDIMKVVKDGEAVLEVINQGSIATRGPLGLPKLQTLIDSVKKVVSVAPTTESDVLDNDDVWQAI